MMIRTLSFLALLSVLGACASTAPSARRAPAEKVVLVPRLPVSAFIDSAALHQALLAAPPAPAGFRLRPLFRVAYDSTGALKEVETISRTHFPQEYGQQMVELLRAHVRPRITTGKEEWNTVWLQSGRSPKIVAIPAVVTVRPRVANTAVVTRELTRVSQRLQQLNSTLAGRQFTAGVSMLVSEEGVPEEPRIERSTGDVQIDREILNVARMMRFTPGMVEEYPVKITVQIPISLVFPLPSVAPNGTPRP
ncbi:MAG TPA: energy transducer TonB [Longimicrobium sp.]